MTRLTHNIRKVTPFTSIGGWNWNKSKIRSCVQTFLLLGLAATLFQQAPRVCAAESAAIVKREKTWTLQNEVMQMEVSFSAGNLALTRFFNREAGVDYLKDQLATPLFSHVINGQTVAANDGGWILASSDVSDIKLYGMKWGKRLELVLTRQHSPVFSIRQIFEIYNGRAGLRCFSFLKNGTGETLTVNSSDVLNLNFPDRPHRLYFIEGILKWRVIEGGLANGGRNGIVRYNTGDGWFAIPENNWATSLTAGHGTASYNEKLLWLNIWNGGQGMRVVINPKAVQLVIFPHEEVEYFSVNLGVFKGDDWDGRMAVSEHFRERFKYHDSSPTLSINDWRWGVRGSKRTDENFRNIAIPKAAQAGFDRVNIDGEWYDGDGTDARKVWDCYWLKRSEFPQNIPWTKMDSLCDFITANGMKPGHWFPLQGEARARDCWANGRDAANPTNITFKIKQTEEVLIGRYRSDWGQLDCGLLWKTDKETAYSHPSDSVYRKLLGMRQYANAITHSHPDFLMQITCEIDNPGTGALDQNIGLAHMPDNGIIGMFRRTENKDDVRDIIGSVGMFPPEGLLSTHGEGGGGQLAWADSPLWYYQFLLARHTSIYSWPGDWSDESIAHLRAFNDWRKNPRIQSVLNNLLRPVYSGNDSLKNEGPWAWMFTDEGRTKALVFALNHLNISRQNAFTAKLRWLDADKAYLVENITQIPGGKFSYAYCGEFSGAQLKSGGLPIDLDAGSERCAAFWIQERTSSHPQVLYTDAAVISYQEKASTGGLKVQMHGLPNTVACLIVYKPAKNGVENRQVKLDKRGRAAVTFDDTTIIPAIQKGTEKPKNNNS